MLRRKVLAQIEEWHQGGRRKALLLTGARQVGKTTVVREFAKQHYTHFVEINFVKRPVAQQAFDGNLDTKTVITNLSAIRDHADKIHRSIVLSRYNVCKKDGVLYFPLYMAMFL